MVYSDGKGNYLNNGFDMTSLLVNPDFEQGKTGWTGFNTVAAQKWNNGSLNMPTTGGPATNTLAEAYSAPEFDLYQVVENAPVGVYEISVQGFCRNGRGDTAWNNYQNQTFYSQPGNFPVYVYLNAKQTPFVNVFSEIKEDGYTSGYVTFENNQYPDDMYSAAEAFSAGMYKQTAYGLVAREGDPLRIGVKGHSAGLDGEDDNLFIFDNFKLTFKGNDATAVQPVLEEEIVTAEASLSKNMGKTAYEHLSAAITAAKAAAAGGEAMFESLSDLYVAEAAADGSIQVFVPLSEALDKLQAEIGVYVDQNPTAAAAAADLYTNISGRVNIHVIQDSEVEGLMNQISAAITRMKLPSYDTASDMNPIDMTSLITNSTFNENTDGWSGTKAAWGGNDAGLAELYSKDYDMYQTILGLPAGTYQVKVQGFYRAGFADYDYQNRDNLQFSRAFLYAQTKDAEDNDLVSSKALMRLNEVLNMEGYQYVNYNSNYVDGYDVAHTYTIAGDPETYKYDLVPSMMYTANQAFMSNYFTNNVVTFKITEGAPLRIGLKNSAPITNDWTVFDNWTLTYFGTESAKTLDGDPSGIKNIDFADVNVKAICVANWDTDGDGELSEAEAAAVTTLGTVFQNNTQITSFNELQYFTGLNSIGDNAFYDCSGLTSVTIPNSVTSIGNDAFKNCNGLTSITIPNSVTSIGDGAFYGCSGLNKVIASDLAAWCGIQFWNRYSNPLSYAKHLYSDENTEVTEIVIPNNVTFIGYGAFWGCSGLTSVTIGNGVMTISGSAFRGCSGLTSVTIPTSVTSIGENAFYGCSCLTSITIPNSVTFIGSGAFVDCSGLTSIAIPNSVTSIGGTAFDGCTGITSINVASGNTKYDSRDNCNAIIETAANTLIIGCQSTVIPNSVTSIGGDGAFYGCTGLTSIEIPNSVTSIGLWAFEGCSGLTSITIPNSVTSIGDGAFYGCSGLTSIDIPNSVTSIGGAAFDGCNSLTSVTVDIASPVSITSNTFTNRAYATLYVPYGCKVAYEAADYWKEFKEIVEMSSPAGNSITIYVQADEAPYLWAWNGLGINSVNIFSEPWPGRQFTEKKTVQGTEFWCYTFDGSNIPINILFNDGGANGPVEQTEDINGITADRYFTYDGVSTYVDVTEQYGGTIDVGGYVYTDNARLKIAGANLVGNGNFANGFTGWMSAEGSTPNSEVFSVEAGVGPNGENVVTSQAATEGQAFCGRWTLEPATYVVSFDVNVPAATNSSVTEGNNNYFDVFINKNGSFVKAESTEEAPVVGVATATYLPQEWKTVSFVANIQADQQLVLHFEKLKAGTMFTNISIHKATPVYDVRPLENKMSFIRELMGDENFNVAAAASARSALEGSLGMYPELLAGGEMDDASIGESFAQMLDQQIEDFLGVTSVNLNTLIPGLDIASLATWWRGGQYSANYKLDLQGSNWGHLGGNDVDVLRSAIQTGFAHSATYNAFHELLPAGKYFFAAEIRNANTGKSSWPTEPVFTLATDGCKMFIANDSIDLPTIEGEQYQRFYMIADVAEDGQFRAGVTWPGTTSGGAFFIRNTMARAFNLNAVADAEHVQAFKKYIAQWNATTSARNTLIEMQDDGNYPWSKQVLADARTAWDPYYNAQNNKQWSDADGNDTGVATTDELNDWALYQGVELYSEPDETGATTRLEYQVVLGYQNAVNTVKTDNKPFTDLAAAIDEAKMLRNKGIYLSGNRDAFKVAIETAIATIKGVRSKTTDSTREADTETLAQALRDLKAAQEAFLNSVQSWVADIDFSNTFEQTTKQVDAETTEDIYVIKGAVGQMEFPLQFVTTDNTVADWNYALGYNGELGDVLHVGGATGSYATVYFEPTTDKDVLQVNFDLWYGELGHGFMNVDLLNANGVRVAGFSFDSYNNNTAYNDFNDASDTGMKLSRTTLKHNHDKFGGPASICTDSLRNSFELILDYHTGTMTGSFVNSSNTVVGDPVAIPQIMENVDEQEVLANQVAAFRISAASYQKANSGATGRRCWFDNLRIAKQPYADDMEEDINETGWADEPQNVEVTDISTLDNVIYIEPTEERTGAEATISFKMKNTAAIRGFQFDLVLPEGVIPVEEGGELVYWLNGDRAPKKAGGQFYHTLEVTKQTDGSYRFLSGAQQDKTFTGSDGEVAVFKVTIADNMQEGEYPVILKNVKLTETDISNYYQTDEVVSKITVFNYVTGDISGDGTVDVSDYIGVANHILGNTPAGFNARAADVNNDNVIDVSDYIGVANIILTGSIYGNANARSINLPKQEEQEKEPQ